MAFTDHIIHHDPTATVAVVDRRAQPGGHWVDAYPYVRLHQPAIFYGVGSMPLGSGGRDLASKPVILDYYGAVQNALEATGRCHFLLEHSYEGEGRCRSLTDPTQVVTLSPRRRLVDTVYIEVSVPSTRPPPFPVAPKCTVVPLNVLETLDQKWQRYVVIGAGKTGMDAILQLLSLGVEADRITWIVSRDPWLIIREQIWPAALARSVGAQARVLSRSRTWQDIYTGFEGLGIFARIWPGREATCFRCATLNTQEIEQVRRVEHVVRMGHVQRIDADAILLDEGTLPTGPDVLHVDCTAQGLPSWPPRPIFEPHRITLQTVAFCQPAASAALVAVAELSLPDDEARNEALLSVLPPSRPEDFLSSLPAFYRNGRAVLRHGAMRRFMLRNRLSLFNHFSLWEGLLAIFYCLPWVFGIEANVRRIAALLPPRDNLSVKTPLP
jgi:hypothetical protein